MPDGFAKAQDSEASIGNGPRFFRQQGSGGGARRGRPSGPGQQYLRAQLEQAIRDLRVLEPGQALLLAPASQPLRFQDVGRLVQQVRELRGQPFRTDAEAREVATALGYRPVGGRSSGAQVFTNGRDYISRDRVEPSTGRTHNGGVWKRASSIRALRNRNTREGTYNRDLTERVGN